MTSSRDQIGYTIGAVAQMFEVHPQTLRGYERQGLLEPSRSSGNTRLFGTEDLLRLKLILSLTRDLGINLAGVEVILNMRDKMERMQTEVDELVHFLQQQFGVDAEAFAARMNAIVRVPPSQPVRVGKDSDG